MVFDIASLVCCRLGNTAAHAREAPTRSECVVASCMRLRRPRGLVIDDRAIGQRPSLWSRAAPCGGSRAAAPVRPIIHDAAASLLLSGRRRVAEHNDASAPCPSRRGYYNHDRVNPNVRQPKSLALWI